ncbi:CamS family sex pheromone protein, partial [Staphylococcus hominis]|uniref:CamS family sex pheromone protein n=1 Tax=Staphylococcus hominis TaxID=1290 RepID=UPI001643A839
KVKFLHNKPNKLLIHFPIDYYPQAQTIPITQYLTQQPNKYFHNIDTYQIPIKHPNNSTPLITKTKHHKHPQLHIYTN